MVACSHWVSPYSFETGYFIFLTKLGDVPYGDVDLFRAHRGFADGNPKRSVDFSMQYTYRKF